MTPKDTEDLREPLFKAVVDGGFTLLGLERRGEELESIFRELTTGDEPDESVSSRKERREKAKAERAEAEKDSGSDDDSDDGSDSDSEEDED